MSKKSRARSLGLPVTMIEPDVRVVDVDQLEERSGENPNVLDPANYAMLVEGIRKWGVLQPLTVRYDASKDGADHDGTARAVLEVVDGAHRLRAIREVGIKRVPVLVSHWGVTDSEAQVLALNRLRGEVDLGRAAAMLRELQADGFEDLTLTGFSGGDIADLLKAPAASDAVFDDLGAGEGDKNADAGERSEHVKKFAIRLSFDRAEDRDRVRAAALSAGPTVEAGLLALLAKDHTCP